MTAERRLAPRHNAKLEAEIDIRGKSCGGSLTRDASENGLLLATTAEARPGDAVTIRCSLGGTVLSVTGTVARRSAVNADTGLAEIAVELSVRNPLVAEIFRQLERRDSAPPSR